MERELRLQVHTSQKSALRIVDDKSDKSLTDDELLTFVNNELFPTLKKLNLPDSTPMKQAIDKLRLYLHAALGIYSESESIPEPSPSSRTLPTSDDGLFGFANNTSHPMESVTNLKSYDSPNKIKSGELFAKTVDVDRFQSSHSDSFTFKIFS